MDQSHIYRNDLFPEKTWNFTEKQGDIFRPSFLDSFSEIRTDEKAIDLKYIFPFGIPIRRIPFGMHLVNRYVPQLICLFHEPADQFLWRSGSGLNKKILAWSDEIHGFMKGLIHI